MYLEPFKFFSAEEAKDDTHIYTTENGRIPQNSMSVGSINWFSIEHRVVEYTIYPLRRGIYMLITEILA